MLVSNANVLPNVWLRILLLAKLNWGMGKGIIGVMAAIAIALTAPSV